MQSRLDQLVEGALPYILVGQEALSAPPLFMPGSFNPLHKGHEGLLLAAEQTSQRDGLFELSVSNVDKPPLGLVDVERRLLQMHGVYSVVLTSAPTFLEKAALFPGAWFAMGFDTATRLLSHRYHDDIPAMLRTFQDLNTRFVVAGRLCNRVFLSLENIEIPAGFSDLFIPIPENLFREDISSTELRRGDVGL